MITVSAEILSKKNNIISQIDCNISKNNISTNIKNLFNKKIGGSNPFLLGASKLSSTAKLSSKEYYYIGNQISNVYGAFNTSYIITVKGEDIETLIIVFDTFNNQYPQSISINGILYTCDSPIFKVLVSKTNNITIIIDNWNTPYYPLRIQGIDTFYIALDQYNIKSIKNSIFDRNNEKNPCYGIFSNVGSVKFIDVDSRVRFYIEMGQLNIGQLCQMYLNNNSIKQEIGLFNTKNWNYNNDTNEVNVSLQDDLINWQSITINRIEYDFKRGIQQSLKYFYNYLKEISEIQGFEFEPLDSKTDEILNNTVIKYVFLESSTLWQAWDKLCQVAFLYIYKNNNNKVVVIHKI